jgi:hypothetical protein
MVGSNDGCQRLVHASRLRRSGRRAGPNMRDPSPLPPSPDYLHHAAARRIVVGTIAKRKPN